MGKQIHVRVKKIRTSQVTVMVHSRSGKPDEIYLMANKDTVIHVGVRGMSKEKKVEEPPLPTVDDFWKKLKEIGGLPDGMKFKVPEGDGIKDV